MADIRLTVSLSLIGKTGARTTDRLTLETNVIDLDDGAVDVHRASGAPDPTFPRVATAMRGAITS
jgi:hypothetical protein